MSGTTTKPKANRPIIVGRIGMRARVAKPGETDAQKAKWQERIAKNGHVSMVLPTEEALQDFLRRNAEMDKQIAAIRAFENYAQLLVTMYEKGELVPSPKAQKPYPPTWAQMQASNQQHGGR